MENLSVKNSAAEVGRERYALAIDLGGTNTEVAVVSRKGEIIGRRRLLTRAYHDGRSFVEVVANNARELMEATGTTECIDGAGVGAPCLNAATGCIEAATDLPWPSPVPLRELLTEALGMRVEAVNDANAAAAGETRYGATKGMKNFVMLTLGTGVGGGVMCDGHLLSGRSGFAAELGHVVVNNGEGRPCGCGRHDCLQTYCSASGVVTTAKKLLEENPGRPSILREMDSEALTAADVSEAADCGDGLALEVWQRTGERLGEACASFAAFADPEAFVFFGGVAEAFPYFVKALSESFDRNALHLYSGKVAMLPSSLHSADTALLGAAALIFDDKD